jgi:hypothetical protein
LPWCVPFDPAFMSWCNAHWSSELLDIVLGFSYTCIFVYRTSIGLCLHILTHNLYEAKHGSLITFDMNLTAIATWKNTLLNWIVGFMVYAITHNKFNTVRKHARCLTTMPRNIVRWMLAPTQSLDLSQSLTADRVLAKAPKETQDK